MGTLKRRTFLPLAAAIGLSRGALAQPRAWRPGLQLYTVRDALAADPDGMLRRVAQLGYLEVEPGGMAGMTSTEFQARLKRHGLAVPSIHAGYDGLRDDLDGVVREARTFGASFVACPSVDAEERRTADDWKRVCRTLARAGRTLRSHGLALAYHNHDYEFAPYADGARRSTCCCAKPIPKTSSWSSMSIGLRKAVSTRCAVCGTTRDGSRSCT